MRYLSVCSGIEAATVAWHPLGWRAEAFSEIEKFPSAVLAHHYPHVPNYGDMTRFQEWPDASLDVLVGGTPCQSFSVAGLRKGMADPRGNLALVYLALADRYRPQWVVWENVPGVLSSGGGRDFGSFLGGLAELGYGWAYRVLDAQYFGVAQRRRRVFVVGCLGDWRGAAAVLFERACLSGNPSPRRESREAVAPTIRADAANGGAGHGARSGDSKDELIVPVLAGSLDTECGGGKMTHQSVKNGHIIGTITARMFNALGPLDVEQGAIIPVCARALNAHTGICAPDFQNFVPIAHPLRAQAQSSHRADSDNFVPIAFSGQMSTPQCDADLTQTLGAKNPMAVAHTLRSQYRSNSNPATEAAMHIQQGMAVRRLTPVECERLQGFPDGYTQVPNWNGWRKLDADETPEQLIADGFQVRQTKKTGKWRVKDVDGPRYKALGNSMAVPCMRWLGERIAAVSAIRGLGIVA